MNAVETTEPPAHSQQANRQSPGHLNAEDEDHEDLKDRKDQSSRNCPTRKQPQSTNGELD